MALTRIEVSKLAWNAAEQSGLHDQVVTRLAELFLYGFNSDDIEIDLQMGVIGVKIPKNAKEHHANVRALGCIITGAPNPTIHHCHGPSLKERGWDVGMAMKQNEALVIPLRADLHVGDLGIDYGYGVQSWERDFGRQADLIDEVSKRLGYDLWELAGRWQRPSKILPRSGL